MRGFRELRRTHPRSYGWGQLKIRTDVGSVDVDGAYDRLRCELLLAIASGGDLVHSRAGADAMRNCLAVLRPGHPLAAGEDEQ